MKEDLDGIIADRTTLVETEWMARKGGRVVPKNRVALWALVRNRFLRLTDKFGDALVEDEGNSCEGFETGSSFTLLDEVNCPFAQAGQAGHPVNAEASLQAESTEAVADSPRKGLCGFGCSLVGLFRHGGASTG
jgi:hypothetical protein